MPPRHRGPTDEILEIAKSLTRAAPKRDPGVSLRRLIDKATGDLAVGTAQRALRVALAEGWLRKRGTTRNATYYRD